MKAIRSIVQFNTNRYKYVSLNVSARIISLWMSIEDVPMLFCNLRNWKYGINSVVTAYRRLQEEISKEIWIKEIESDFGKRIALRILEDWEDNKPQ